MRRMNFVWAGCLVLAAGAAQAANVTFTGSDDCNFSTAANWDQAPVSKDTLRSINGTSAAKPAQVDPAFTADFGNAYIAPSAAGTAVVEVPSGAKFKAINLYIGHNIQPALCGQLTVRAGGALEGQFGTAMIGVKGKGVLTVEPGADISWPGLNAGSAGILAFKFGANSVATFKANSKKAGQNLLDGLIQADLAQLKQAGDYVLIDGAAQEIGGALRIGLDAQSGAFSGSGDFVNSNFSVLNGGNWSWTLKLDDKNRDLVLTVNSAGTATSVVKTVQAKTWSALKKEGWSLEPWRAFPFEYKELFAREVPFWAPGADDLVRAGDSWVGGEKSKTEQPVPAQTNGTLKVTDFYVSGGGNEKGPNRIFCASAVPKEGKGPFPVLFVFHGGGGHASGALAMATARKNPGFAAVAVDYNGQFSPSKTPVTEWVTQTKEFRESQKLDLVPDPLNFPMYHNVQAARRVLDWTQEQPWADKNKFGAVGISYGGWVALILAGVDDRIGCVVTHVSAGGTEGLQSRAGRPQFSEPADQRLIWLANADPMAYAAKTRAPVFMELSANDRWFWISGAFKHQKALGAKASWLLTPNSDHGSGGPDIADASGLWTAAVFMGGLPFPVFKGGNFSKDGKTVVIQVESKRPVKTVFAAWSAGNEISPARYWRWVEAKEINGTWTAQLPAGHEALAGTVYFTVTDIDGRAVSSALIERSGQTKCMTWAGGSLWDIETGPAAWRPAADLAGEVKFAAQGTRVLMTPATPGKPSAAISNSLNIPAADGAVHRGLKIELGGNGKTVKARVILARNYAAMDAQLFSAELQIPAEFGIFELPWEGFKPYRPSTTEKNPLPANGVIIQSDAFPATGISVGPVHWLD
jgi:dienelactone hydrolase